MMPNSPSGTSGPFVKALRDHVSGDRRAMQGLWPEFEQRLRPWDTGCKEGRANLYKMFMQKAVTQLDPVGFENRDPLDIISDTVIVRAPADATRGFSPTAGYIRCLVAALDNLTATELATLVWRQFGKKLHAHLVQAVPKETRPRLRTVFRQHDAMRWTSIQDLHRLQLVLANFDKNHCEVLRAAFSGAPPRVNKVHQGSVGYTTSCFLCGATSHKMDSCPKKGEVCKHKRRDGTFWPLVACFRCSPRGRIAELYYQKMVAAGKDDDYIKKRLPDLWKMHAGKPIANLQQMDSQPARVFNMFNASYNQGELGHLWSQSK